MKRQIHILLALVIFALTQFVSPFAHAHVGGVQGNSAIHLGDMPHAAHCHIESHESRSIDPQQEYQRDDAAARPVIAASAVLHPAARGGSCLPHKYDPLHSAAYAYHRPRPQAPPA